MQKECPVCLGSGQISYFKGVSRFILSEEDCPACAGMGFLIEPEEGAEPPPSGRGTGEENDGRSAGS